MINSINDVEEVLIKDFSKKKEVPDSFYPSKASVELEDGTVVGECLRKLYYEYTGEPISDPIPIKSIYKIEIGNRIHEWFLGKLKESKGGESEVEAHYKDPELEREIHGRIDHKREDGSIVEVKSTFGMGFKDIPKREHELQIRIYDFLTGYAAKFLELVYIARDSANRKSFLIPSDKSGPLSYPSAKKRWVKLESLIKAKTLPDRDFEEKNWHCQYCSFKGTCWGAEPKDKINHGW